MSFFLILVFFFVIKVWDKFYVRKKVKLIFKNFKGVREKNFKWIYCFVFLVLLERFFGKKNMLIMSNGGIKRRKNFKWLNYLLGLILDNFYMIIIFMIAFISWCMKKWNFL